MSPKCYKCHKIEHFTMNLCDNCLTELEERSPDTTGKLIVKFLEDIPKLSRTELVKKWYKKLEERKNEGV